jgi:DNA-binding IclR family transcriptional regulator
MKPKYDTTVKSSVRTLQIFEYFSEFQAPARLTDIARYLSCPPSSAFSLLRSLVETGYIEHDKINKTFMPTLRSSLVGAWVSDSLMSDESIVRFMINLKHKLKAAVVLGTKNGLHVQYLQVQTPEEFAAGHAILPGAVRPLLRSAMGHAFLSSMDPERVPPIARRLNSEEKDPENLVNIAELMAKLEQCRAEGYAYTEGAATKGWAMMAMLLATPPHQPPLGLGLGGPINYVRAHKTTLLRALRDVVEKRRRQMESRWQLERFAMPAHAKVPAST